MADFQYLPMQRKEDSSYCSLESELRISSLHKRAWFLDSSVSLHLPPAIFSRIDTPMDYHYRDGPYKSDNPLDKDKEFPEIIKMGKVKIIRVGFRKILHLNIDLIKLITLAEGPTFQ